MDADHTDKPLLSLPLVRGLIAVGCLGAFFVVASVINPDNTEAGSTDPGNHLIVDSGGSTEPGQQALLGTLLGTRYTVEIYGTDQGVLYTVFDELSRTVVELATPEQVREKVPDLDLESLQARQIGEVDTCCDPFGGF